MTSNMEKLNLYNKLRKRLGDTDFVSIKKLCEITGISKSSMYRLVEDVPKIGTKVYLPDIINKIYFEVRPYGRKKG